MSQDSHGFGPAMACYNHGVTDRTESEPRVVGPLGNSAPVESAARKRPRDGWDTVLMVGGAMGMLASFFGAAILGVLAIFSGDGSDPLQPGLQAISLVAVSALGIPLIYWGAVGTRRRRVERPWPAWIVATVIYPISLGIGFLAFEAGTLPWLLGPIAHLLAAAAPVLFVTSIVLRRGALLSARRRWAHFLAGLWVSPPLSLFVELLGLIPAGLLLAGGLSFSQDGFELLRAFVFTEVSSEAEALELAGKMLSQPVVVMVLLGYLSGVVPLIEEALKSIAIWPLLRRPLSAGQAFLGGALAGAGYALFESLFLPQAGEDWMVTMLARTGTPLIHAFNTGMVALGLAEAFRRKRWIRLPLLYGSAVVLHGLWNLFAVSLGVSSFGMEAGVEILAAELLGVLNYIGSLGLLGLAALSLAGLIWLPAKLEAD